MERKDGQSVPLTLKKIYEPLFRFVLADRLAREARRVRSTPNCGHIDAAASRNAATIAMAKD
jgi:hypothetical protein